MKYIIILLTVLISYSFTHKNDGQKITVLFSNYSHTRPIATTKENFWLDRRYFDTVIISSNNLASFFTSKLQNLPSSSQIDFDHHAAFIMYHSFGAIDTFYTDTKFYYWSHKDQNYIDTSGFFEKAFSKFSILNQ